MDKEANSSLSPSDDSDFSDTVLKYINQVLLEEDFKEKPCMFHDSLALQAAEKSLYDVLGESYPPHDQASLCSDHSTYTSSSSCASSSFDSRWNGDFADYNDKPSLLQTSFPDDSVFCLLRILAHNLLLVFKMVVIVIGIGWGVDEASKFLPKCNQLTIDFESNVRTSELKQKAPKTVVKVENDGKEHSPPHLTGKKNHEREDEDLEEGRNNKQSVVSEVESELSDMFDKVLICGGRNEEFPACTADKTLQNGPGKTLQPMEKTNESGTGKARGKKGKKKAVDLRNLLILCAQAVSSDDGVTAKKLLKQINRHSSISALFDMCETNICHEDHMRLMLEQKFYGPEMVNVVVCEGTERVQRPESFKQWQIRTARAGFTQLPLDAELMKKSREKVEWYHSDFIVDVAVMEGSNSLCVFCLGAYSFSGSSTSLTRLSFKLRMDVDL
ncbi:hypothetical protein V6N13_052079 [Hibiscus sabdariffa]|uniref:Uncharacterized protein n=2 Tax=Hibiscus sabdariffa TaxID=183260 RepID=A0ABR2A3A1_9ROSI